MVLPWQDRRGQVDGKKVPIDSAGGHILPAKASLQQGYVP